VLPILARFADRFGKLMIHFCTTPAPSAHVLPVLCETDAVGAVDNWQGPDALMGESVPTPMQSTVAVVTDVDLGTPEAMDTFLSWPPVRDVPRNPGRGLVVQTATPSVADAQRIYADWRCRFD